MRSKKIIIIYALIIVLLLFAVAMYYYKNQKDVGIRTGLVGDAVCGNIPSSAGQDACCAEAHKGDSHIECVGSWKFIEDESICRFVCEGGILDNPQEECERVGGVWKEFNNGCVDSCVKERSSEPVFCTQVLTDGCDCGPDRCWNGESCEGN